MGTDYSLGIITKFSATSNTELTGEEWLNVLNERIDVSLFDLETAEKEAMGALQKDVFRENITGFYDVLRKILGANRNGDRKSTRLNSSHVAISYAVFCLKK